MYHPLKMKSKMLGGGHQDWQIILSLLSLSRSLALSLCPSHLPPSLSLPLISLLSLDCSAGVAAVCRSEQKACQNIGHAVWGEDLCVRVCAIVVRI